MPSSLPTRMVFLHLLNLIINLPFLTRRHNAPSRMPLLVLAYDDVETIRLVRLHSRSCRHALTTTTVPLASQQLQRKIRVRSPSNVSNRPHRIWKT
jgi:hypothetical protein